jgi:hypothetical protein
VVAGDDLDSGSGLTVAAVGSGDDGVLKCPETRFDFFSAKIDSRLLRPVFKT